MIEMEIMESPSIESESDELTLPPATPEQIITFINGKFTFNASKLVEIVSNIPNACADTQVACICLIGHAKSGKSFLTNLLLQYLAVGGEGNWIGKVIKKQDKLEGFPWNETLPNHDKKTSNISLWSRPFEIKRCNGERIILFVLDCSNDAENPTVQKAFEILVWLLCPTVVVTQLNNIDLDFLNLRKKLMETHPSPVNNQLYWIIQNFIQKGNTISYGKSNPQKLNKYVAEQVHGLVNEAELLTLWDEIETKTGFAFPAPGNPTLTDEDGFLTLQITFINHVKKFISDLLDTDEIACSSKFKVGTVQEYFERSVKWANTSLVDILPGISEFRQNEVEPTPDDVEKVYDETEDIDNGSQLSENDSTSNGNLAEVSGGGQHPQSQGNSTVESSQENYQHSSVLEKTDSATTLQAERTEEMFIPPEEHVKCPEAGVVNPNMVATNSNDKVTKRENLGDSTKGKKTKKSGKKKNKKQCNPKTENGVEDKLSAESKDLMSFVEISPSNNSTEETVSKENGAANEVAVNSETGHIAKNEETPIDLPIKSLTVDSPIKTETVNSSITTETVVDSPIKTNNNSKTFEKNPIEWPEEDGFEIVCKSDCDVNTLIDQKLETTLSEIGKERKEQRGQIFETSTIRISDKLISKPGEIIKTNRDLPECLASSNTSGKDSHPVFQEPKTLSGNERMEYSTKEDVKSSFQISATSSVNAGLKIHSPVQNQKSDHKNKEPFKGQSQSSGQVNVETSIIRNSNNLQIKPGKVFKNNQEIKSVKDSNAVSPKTDKPPSVIGKVEQSKDKKSGNPQPQIAALPDVNKRSKTLTHEQKQEMDQKVQEKIAQITQNYIKALTDFTTTPRGQDALQNKHSNLLKVAEEQLHKLFASLYISGDESQSMEKTLKSRLQMEYKKVSKNAKSLAKQLPDNTPLKSNADLTVENKQTEKKLPEPPPVFNNSESKRLELLFQERVEKMFDMYIYDISNAVQMNGSDEQYLRNFHQQELTRIMKHLIEISHGMNIQNIPERLENIKIRLDTEFLKYLPTPLDDPEPLVVFSQDELNTAVHTGMENLLLFTISAKEHIFNMYDSDMKKVYGQPVAQLNFAHQQFMQRCLSPENFWSSIFGQIFTYPIDQQKQRMVRDHIERCLLKKKEYYESVIKNRVCNEYLCKQLVTSCVDKYQAQINAAIAKTIQVKGFVPETIKQTVTEAHNGLVSSICEIYCHDVYFSKQDMTRRLTQSVKQLTDNASSFLENVVKVYQNRMESHFGQQMCFSKESLDVCHEEAKRFTKTSPVGVSALIDVEVLCENALNFSKGWYVNKNEEILSSENNSALNAMKIVEQYYSQEMNRLLSSNVCSNKILTEMHTVLKNETVAAFRRATPLHQDMKYGLLDCSPQLESSLDDLLLEFMKNNGKKLETEMKSIKTITSNAIKTFNAEVLEKMSPRCVTDQEFEEIIDGTKMPVLAEMRKKISEQVPNENFEVHEKVMAEHITKFQEEVRISNIERRKEELLIIEQRRIELLKDETNRGCLKPTLCIEFGLKTIRYGFEGSNGNFSYFPNHSDGQMDIKNIISFLNTNEVIVGDMEAEKQREIFESISLDSQFASSSVANDEDDDTKEINFKGGKIPRNLEFLCSIIFSKLKEAAEKVSQEKFCSAVISVPLRFHSRQRQIIKTAGRIAGFAEVYLINDTTAAALHYFRTKQSRGPNSSCLVVSPGIVTCDTALYSYSKDENLKMECSFGDRNMIVKPKSSLWNAFSYIPNLFSSAERKEDIHSSVVKEVVKSKKKIDSTILLCDNDKTVIRKCSGDLENVGLKSVIVYCNDKSSLFAVLDGIREYSQKLKANIHQAKSSISDLPCYNFVLDDGLKKYDIPLLSRNSTSRWETNLRIISSTSETKILSFNELAEDSTRFHFGRAEFIAEKGKEIDLKTNVSQEGIFNVQLMCGGMLVNIDSYNLTEEQCANYAEMIEKYFKKDPALETLEKLKMKLCDICQDMKDRLNEVKASDFMKENITKEIKIGIQLSENSSVNLQALESKIKMLETLRDKKYPKK